MNRVFFAIPGDHEQISGGYIFDRKIFYGLKHRGLSIEWIHLPNTFPHPPGSDLTITEKLLSDLPEGSILILDGLAGCRLPNLLRCLSVKIKIVYLMHLPVFLDPKFDQAEKDNLGDSELESLHNVHRIIVSSDFVARKINSPGKMTVINPGIEVSCVKSDYPQLPAKLLMVGNFLPRKGYDDLLTALHRNANLEWVLTCCGNSTIDRNYYNVWSKKVLKLTLSSRITTGVKHDYEELENIYLNSHLLVFPSHFESYGMAPAEAAAHRLPMLISDGGALTETISGKFALFHKAGNVNDLADKLNKLLTNGKLYKRMVDAFNNSAPHFKTWDESIESFYNVLESLTDEPA